MYLETSSKWHRTSHLRMRQGRLVSSFPGVKLLAAGVATSQLFWERLGDVFFAFCCNKHHCIEGKSLFSSWKIIFQTIKSWEIADWIWSFSLRRDSGNQNAVHCRSMFWLHCQFGHCQLGLCEHKRVDSITGTATLFFHVWQPSRLRSSGMIWVCRTKV